MAVEPVGKDADNWAATGSPDDIFVEMGGDVPQPAARSMARQGDADVGVTRGGPYDGLPSSYRAPWPSLWARVARWCRPLWDIYFVVALFILYGTPKAEQDDTQAWRIAKEYSWALIWIPFVYRFFTGFLHWVLSLVIVPGTILYMRGPALKLLPKGLQEKVNENNVVRSTRRDELLAVTRGKPVRIITPDGVELDAVYWAGRGASRDGATVVRMNGNAEAFELQDDVLPLMYATRGINVLLFNYRGVGESMWTPLYGSAGLGHLWGIWSMPAACGLQLDAWTAIQFLIRQLQVPPDKVCVVGHSMGGAVAAQLLASQSKLPLALCCTRTFAYMSCIAGQLAPLFLAVDPDSFKATLLTKFTSGLVIASGWQHRSLSNFHKVRGRKWLEFCTADHIIPTDLSLPAAVRAQHIKASRKSAKNFAGQEECVELEAMHHGISVLAGPRCPPSHSTLPLLPLAAALSRHRLVVLTVRLTPQSYDPSRMCFLAIATQLATLPRTAFGELCVLTCLAALCFTAVLSLASIRQSCLLCSPRLASCLDACALSRQKLGRCRMILFH